VIGSELRLNRGIRSNELIGIGIIVQIDEALAENKTYTRVSAGNL
jgi:hypothetical protein